MTEEQIKKLARLVYPDYKGRKIKYKVQTDPIDCNYDANWSGGTRTYYKFIRLDSGSVMQVPDFAPWKRPDNMKVILPEGCVCVTHSHFCGHDMGLTVIFPKTFQIESKVS